MQTSMTNLKPKNPTNIFQDKNFYIVNLVTVMGIVGGTLFNPVLPTIQHFFQVSEAQISWTAALYQLPSAIITPIFGILADSLGRKAILIPSLLLFAFSGLFSGLTSNFTTHLGWRLLQGVGAASLEPLQVTIIADLYRGRSLGMAMAFNASLIGISGALLPLIGGKLGEFNWRYTFFASVLAAPLAVIALIMLKVPKQQHTQKFDFNAYVQNTWSNINQRPVIGLLFAVMALFLLQTLCLTFIPFLAVEKFQTSDTVNGFILTSMSISLAITASQLGRLLRHLSEIKLIKLSFLLFAIALFILPLVSNFWLLFIPMFLLGVAQGVALPCSQALLAGLAAQESRAGFMAINMTILSWGQTLGPVLGSIAVVFGGIKAVFYTSAVFALISFTIFNFLLTTKVFSFTAKTIHLPLPPSNEPPSFVSEPLTSPTIVQQPIGQLFHPQTHQTILFPENFEVITIGKVSDRIYPDINLADLPNSEVVSRIHAQIRFDGQEYYIQDMGSTNGTFINKYPLIPGTWYKLKPELSLSFGRREAVQLIFQIA
ncbi:MFS transporter [Calothrix sp. FACHB-1219]|uniref:MFS transporter n=2 Tax=Calothrix TaxID=1186 RepID=UPI0016838810|nr:MULTISPECIES: MFS transporter [unclassified Calothrix]MBD2202663.1 MFS transporter [Calothrix sp. FACHB-168]MBD2218816.1 MFS transporter [Calothrix sp. FACHB-1219]